MIDSNNRELEITKIGELSTILNYYNDDFIFITVTESLNNRIRPYPVSLPNMVIAFENNFKLTLDTYPMGSERIFEVREGVYDQIICLLCDFYNIKFDDVDGMYDKYTSAMLMYSMLVSDFQSNVIAFFSNFIYNEKSSIYEMLELSDARKSKDSSTIYAKKVFRNPKLSVISANLESVILSIINTFDVQFETFVDSIYFGTNKAFGDHIKAVASPIGNFVKDYIGPIIMGEMGPVLITYIRLALQQYASNEFTQSIIKED